MPTKGAIKDNLHEVTRSRVEGPSLGKTRIQLHSQGQVHRDKTL